MFVLHSFINPAIAFVTFVPLPKTTLLQMLFQIFTLDLYATFFGTFDNFFNAYVVMFFAVAKFVDFFAALALNQSHTTSVKMLKSFF